MKKTPTKKVATKHAREKLRKSKFISAILDSKNPLVFLGSDKPKDK